MANDITLYTPTVASRADQIAHILGEMATGRPVTRILAEDDGMPSPATFWRWHMEDNRLREDFVRAREAGLEVHAEEIIAIADMPVEAVELMEEIGPDGAKRRRTVKEALGHRRLQIETRVKRMQLIAPRKYGPKLDITSDGEKLSSIADAIAAGNKRLEGDAA